MLLRKLSLSVLDRTDIFQLNGYGAVGLARERDVFGAAAVLSWERELDARVGANLVTFRHAAYDFTFERHTLGQLDRLRRLAVELAHG